MFPARLAALRGAIMIARAGDRGTAAFSRAGTGAEKLKEWMRSNMTDPIRP
jgi:hypothetical protein